MVLKVAYSKDDRDELIKKGFKKIGVTEDKDGEEITVYRSTRKKRTAKVDSKPKKPEKVEEEKTDTPRSGTHSQRDSNNRNSNPNSRDPGNRNRNTSN